MTVKRVQHLRFSPNDASTFTGLEGEIVIELDTFLVRVQDGVTPGGFTTLTRETADSLYASLVDFNSSIADVQNNVAASISAAVDAVLGSLLIQAGPVVNIVATLPGSPGLGDRYLIAHSATTGSAVGHEDEVAQYTTDGWLFSSSPREGNSVYNQTDNTEYYWSGSAWGTTATDATLIALGTAIDTLNTEIALKAPLANPALTGVPTAPTAAVNTNTTQLATTAFVLAQLAETGSGGSLGTNGSVVLPNGLILKWGHYAGGSSTPSVTFDTAFPNACLNIQITSVGTAADTADAADTATVRYTTLNTFNETGFTGFCSAEMGIEDVFHAYTGVEFYWFALGH